MSKETLVRVASSTGEASYVFGEEDGPGGFDDRHEEVGAAGGFGFFAGNDARGGEGEFAGGEVEALGERLAESSAEDELDVEGEVGGAGLREGDEVDGLFAEGGLDGAGGEAADEDGEDAGTFRQVEGEELTASVADAVDGLQAVGAVVFEDSGEVGSGDGGGGGVGLLHALHAPDRQFPVADADNLDRLPDEIGAEGDGEFVAGRRGRAGRRRGGRAAIRRG